MIINKYKEPAEEAAYRAKIAELQNEVTTVSAKLGETAEQLRALNLRGAKAELAETLAKVDKARAILEALQTQIETVRGKVKTEEARHLTKQSTLAAHITELEIEIAGLEQKLTLLRQDKASYDKYTAAAKQAEDSYNQLVLQIKKKEKLDKDLDRSIAKKTKEQEAMIPALKKAKAENEDVLAKIEARKAFIEQQLQLTQPE